MHTHFSERFDLSTKWSWNLPCFILNWDVCVSGEYLKIKRVYYIRKKKMWDSKAMTAVVPDIPDTWKWCPIAGTHWRKAFPEPAILHYSFAFVFQSIFKFQESLPVYTDTTCSLNVCLWIVKCILSSALKQIVQKVAAALCWSMWSSAGTKKPSWGSRLHWHGTAHLCQGPANISMLLLLHNLLQPLL